MRRSRLAIACLVLAGAATSAAAGDRVVARVGNTPITRLEVLSVQAEKSDMTYRQALDLLVERNLILAWARDKGLRVPDQEVEDIINSIRKRNNLTQEQFEDALAKQGTDMASFRDRIRDQVLVTEAMSAALADRAKPTAEEVDEAYRKRYLPREVVTIRHILLAVPKGEEGAEVQARREEASVLLGRIRGGEPFDQVARERSEDAASASKGGNLGTFAMTELMPALKDAVSDLPVGEVGGPFRTDLGYHLLEVTDRKTEPPPPLETVRDQLGRELAGVRQEEVRRQWIQELRQEYYVEVFPEG